MVHEVAMTKLTKEGSKLCPSSRYLHRTLKSLKRMLEIFLDVSSGM